MPARGQARTRRRQSRPKVRVHAGTNDSASAGELESHTQIFTGIWRRLALQYDVIVVGAPGTWRGSARRAETCAATSAARTGTFRATAPSEYELHVGAGGCDPIFLMRTSAYLVATSAGRAEKRRFQRPVDPEARRKDIETSQFHRARGQMLTQNNLSSAPARQALKTRRLPEVRVTT